MASGHTPTEPLPQCPSGVGSEGKAGSPVTALTAPHAAHRTLSLVKPRKAPWKRRSGRVLRSRRGHRSRPGDARKLR
ncbi:hypothetical protein AAFF_G00434330 [Aldrovandia affinis]|uniref:Uncharacterized protein n=1 Tax=Aldrovandia affinis TaxID=143900 RepID=A0AAD7S896_9TELE|nr:hypothetical protein AAFF_G00434330 [Aldrovandia affinis]